MGRTKGKIAHDPRNKEPVRLLTTINPTTTEEALAIFGYYLERWGKEEGYRFTKSFLNLENIRMFNFNAISNLSFLVFPDLHPDELLCCRRWGSERRKIGTSVAISGYFDWICIKEDSFVLIAAAIAHG